MVKITIKHLNDREIIILSIVGKDGIINEFEMNGCEAIAEGQIMKQGHFYDLYRKMQRTGCNDKSIEQLEV